MSGQNDAFLRALRQMFEDNINPYNAVSESLARGIERERAEREWWDQFLPGRSGATATIEVAPPGREHLRIRYAPDPHGGPRAGEIVWTWAPTVAAHGAYRPVLLLARGKWDRFYAVRLVTRSREGDQRYFPIGAGPRDSRGRLSWVDIDHILSVHVDGMHREEFIMDRDHFIRVADELYRRHGWPMDD